MGESSEAEESLPEPVRSMPLCLVNGAFKPFKGPFHGKRLRGGEGETKADRWSEGSSSSIAQSPGRGGGGGGGRSSRSSHEQE